MQAEVSKLRDSVSCDEGEDGGDPECKTTLVIASDDVAELEAERDAALAVLGDLRAELKAATGKSFDAGEKGETSDEGEAPAEGDDAPRNSLRGRRGFGYFGLKRRLK